MISYLLLGKLRKNHAVQIKIYQFPMTLAWAITCHKMQGQTIKPPLSMILDFTTFFEGGQAYVALSRIQSMNQLIIKKMDESIIRCNQRALEEMRRLLSIEEDIFPTWTEDDNNNIKFVQCNIRSIR